MARRPLFMLMLLASFAIGALAASAEDCPREAGDTPPAACLEAALAEAEAALVVAQRDADHAIPDWRGALTAEDRAAWRAEFDAVMALWTGFRDAACSARLLGFERLLEDGRAAEASQRCRLGVTRVIVADLTNRFGEAIPELRRAHFAALPDGRGRRAAIAPTGAGPLCPALGGDAAIARCMAEAVGRIDRERDRVDAAVLVAIAGRDGLSPADRSIWASLARAAAAGWGRLRERGCAVEAYETADRRAPSVYPEVVAPCLIAETEARIAALRAVYGVN